MLYLRLMPSNSWITNINNEIKYLTKWLPSYYVFLCYCFYIFLLLYRLVRLQWVFCKVSVCVINTLNHLVVLQDNCWNILQTGKGHCSDIRLFRQTAMCVQCVCFQFFIHTPGSLSKSKWGFWSLPPPQLKFENLFLNRLGKIMLF